MDEQKKKERATKEIEDICQRLDIYPSTGYETLDHNVRHLLKSAADECRSELTVFFEC